MSVGSTATFAELGLPSELVEVLDRKLITEPFDIQTLAIPDALVGRDILGRAPTGSGKTLAFGLPMLARLEKGRKKLPRGLVLSPTRELAEQICRELEPLAAAMDRSVLAVYGGVGLDRQIRALRKGVDVLVACPGRLLDLIEQRAVRLDEVDIVVVDEADRMADMGFLPDVRRLLDQTNENRQTLLFSATLDNDVQVLIDTYQDDPAVHQVGEVEPDLSLVDHRFIKVKKPDRIWLAADLIAGAGPTVVFVRTRHGVDRLARQLKQEGIRAGYIHGGRSQSQRDRALQVFIQGKVDALVATDVAARGIHVDGVACVIHYDPPADIKDYVHRSGRTARAGAGGTVVSFLDGPQVKESQKMQRKLSLEADIEGVPARQPRSSRPTTVEDVEKRPAKGRARSNGHKPASRTRGGPSKAGGGASKGGRTRSRADGGSRARSRSGSGDGPMAESRPAGSGGKTRARSGSESRSGRPGAKPKPKARSGERSVSDSRSDGSRSDGSAAKPKSRAGGKARAKARPTGTARAKARPTGTAKAKRRTSRSSTGTGSTSTGAKRSSSSAKPGTAKPRTGSPRTASAGAAGTAKKAGSKTGAKKGGVKNAATKNAGPKKTKRSGKPRPKNRKNQPKAGRK